jgi:GTP-binding protein
MMIDEATITFTGGHGGTGIVSFGKMTGSGPDGGNGGRGGDIFVEAASDLTLLAQFLTQTEFEAENGIPGGKKKATGRDGKDLTILLPVGTTLTEIETVREPGLVTSGETIDLVEVGQRVMISKGGRGGRGNFEFRSPRRTTPKFAQNGLPGEKRLFHINLKLIADFGFVGLPNAGKSSLLNELTNAKAKVGNYAFTTLSPNLGVMEKSILADIPGLIEGAHTGRGLGFKFLKHIEKVNVILHCISAENENAWESYETIRTELASYKKDLVQKKEVIVITKVDLVDEKKVAAIVKLFKKSGKEVLTASIYDPESIAALKKHLLNLR